MCIVSCGLLKHGVVWYLYCIQDPASTRLHVLCLLSPEASWNTELSYVCCLQWHADITSYPMSPVSWVHRPMGSCLMSTGSSGVSTYKVILCSLSCSGLLIHGIILSLLSPVVCWHVQLSHGYTIQWRIDVQSYLVFLILQWPADTWNYLASTVSRALLLAQEIVLYLHTISRALQAQGVVFGLPTLRACLHTELSFVCCLQGSAEVVCLLNWTY